MKAVRSFHTGILVSMLFACMVFLPLSAQAQRGRMSTDDRVKRLADQLSLTKEQADSVRSILTSAEKERTEIFQAHQGDRDSVRALMRKQTEAVDAKIQALLTADQKTAYEKVKKERQAMMGGPRRPRPDNQ